MDQYLSTYTKDYVWHCPKKIRTTETPYEDRMCYCGTEPGGYLPPRQYSGLMDGENYEWSRLQPLGPLLDPKMYCTKTGPVPEFDVTRYDQPNTYLKKLQEKYPYLYDVLQKTPPDEMVRRVDEDRLRTTYQVDYGHIDEHPSAEYDSQLAKRGFSSNCSKPIVMDCREHIRPQNCFDFDSDEPHNLQYMKNGSGFSYRAIREDSSNRSGGFGSVRKNPAGNDDYGAVERDSDRSGGYKAGGNDFNRSGGYKEGGKDFDRSGGYGAEGKDSGRGRSSDQTRNVMQRKNNANGEPASGARDLPTKATLKSTGGGGGKSDSGGFGSSGNGEKKRSGKTVDDSDASKKPLPAWISEYQEVIGQTGQDIVRDKMHQHGGKSPGRVFMERAIMHCRTY